MSNVPPSFGLDDVLITEALAQRSPRTPNLQAETQALHALARRLADQCQTMLKTLATMAKDLCYAATAGVSLLEVRPDGEEIFRWTAIAGALEACEGETAPRNFSPCGVCLDRQAPQLYSYPERYFINFQQAKPTIVECLVVPLVTADQPFGTIWLVSHDETRQFDAEDVRIMTSLADFTAAAMHSIHLRQAAEVALQHEQAARQEAEAARQALDEASQRAIDILESITDAFVCLDHEWQITYVNQETARLNNLQPEEMIGKTESDLQPWLIGTVIKQTHDRVTAEQKTTHFEILYEPTSIWLEIHAYPCRIGFSIYFRDITDLKRNEAERQQVEAALRQSESRFRLIVESAKDYAIFTLNLDGLITSWNPGAERLLGFHETEIIGCHGRIIFTPEDRAQKQAEQELQTALTQERAEDERWHLRKDGSRFFASGLMTQLHDEAGNLQGFVKILRDVTETHQAAEREQFLAEASAALAGSIDYKTTLFNIARLAVPFLADFCFFDVLNTNNQVERVAWHHSDPTNHSWFEQFQGYGPPQDDENHPITKVLTTGNTNFVPHVETWIQTAAINAEYLEFIQNSHVRSLITVPLIAHGRKLGALTVCLTTSNRYYTQTDLTLAEELGHRAALALDNARLYQQAQEVNRIKDEFLAVLSHELRSPLNPILGWIQLIQKGTLDRAKTAQALETIERNARLQAHLIEDLLDVSRLLRGKLSLNASPVNLADTIQAAIETIQLAAQAKAIEIQATIDHQVGPVSGDATRLQQVVWNLLSNAVKFTPEEGRVEIRLSLATGVSFVEDQQLNTDPEQMTNYAQITVTDTGVGIHPDFLPHVFDYFRQADGASTRRYGGLGLGLAIVRQIVEAHGGLVAAESPGEGQGTTFTIRLPLLEKQKDRELEVGEEMNALTPAFSKDAPQAKDALQAAPSPLTKLQILVVDNEPDTLDFVTVLLKQAGANVITATSAKEALTALMKINPDVLLSDIGMPNVDGYMLMQHVRTLPPEKGGQVPAIALTAYTGDRHCQQILSVGFQRHLTKPVEPEVLVKTIAELMKPNKLH